MTSGMIHYWDKDTLLYLFFLTTLASSRLDFMHTGIIVVRFVNVAVTQVRKIGIFQVIRKEKYTFSSCMTFLSRKHDVAETFTCSLLLTFFKLLLSLPTLKSMYSYVCMQLLTSPSRLDSHSLFASIFLQRINNS